MTKYVNRVLRLLDPEFYEQPEEFESIDTNVNKADGGGNYRPSVISVFHNLWVRQQSSQTITNSQLRLPSSQRRNITEEQPTFNPGDPNDGKFLTPKVLTRCFSYLRARDLKTCRLVCRFWKVQTAPVFKEKTCLVINGEDSGSILKDSCAEKCVRYLKHSVSKFSPWSRLRLWKVKEYQIRILVSSRDFQIAVKSILELELLFCDISWKSLLKILKQFINLQSFLDNRSIYRNDQEYSWYKRWRYTITSHFHKKSNPVKDFVMKDVCLEDLKSLEIHKTDCGPNTTNLIKILTVTTMDLHEFTLKADPRNTGQNIKDTFEFERNLNILFILSSHSLKRLSVDMLDTNNIDFFNIFLQSFKDWSSPLTKTKFILEELSLKFKYVWLSKNFENILIPFVKKLENLQLLELGLIAFNSENAHMLQSLKVALPLNCIFEFGLFLSDHDYHKEVESIVKQIEERTEEDKEIQEKEEEKVDEEEEEIEQDFERRAQIKKKLKKLKKKLSNSLQGLVYSSQTILKLDLYRQHMTDLLISIFHDEVTGVQNLIPGDFSGGTFDKTQDLGIFTDGARRNFASFDIPIICHYFKNLTKLEIVDGPWEIYFQEVFRKVSEAFISNEDLQLILKHLVKLQTLMIFCNMANVTDSGVTGFSTAVCYRMRTTNDFSADVSLELDGYSFANLKELRYLSLRGIGTNLTDVSVYWGFANPHLKTLIVAHLSKITDKGRQKLEDMYPASAGRFVAIF